MNEPHPVRWRSLIGLGLLGVLLSLFMLIFTALATELIMTIAGFIIIMLSAVFLVEGFCIESGGWPRWLILGIGLLGLVVGILSVAVPSFLTVTVSLLTGIFLIIYGIGESAVGVGAVFADTMVRMVFLMLGIFSVVVGLFLVLKPSLAIDIIVWLLGFYLLVLGLMRVAQGLNERDAESKVTVKRL